MSPSPICEFKNINELAQELDLIASPEDHHGKRVKVVGYATIAFEDTALYVSENDAKVFIPKNALWLSLDDRAEQYKKYHHEWIVVEGVFDVHGHGHLGLYSASIKDITRLEEHQGRDGRLSRFLRKIF